MTQANVANARTRRNRHLNGRKPASEISMVDPEKCRIWHLHYRHADTISAESCLNELESIRQHGQLVPALGRRLEGDPQYEFEIICGARRLFIARKLQRPLIVELRNLSDRDALIAMDMENRLRLDVSAYERGMSYARWLRSGQFESQEDIASALNISASQVSRLLQLARLPAAIVNAFPHSDEICERWGLQLAAALDDPERRGTMLRTVRTMGASATSRSSRDVYRSLLASGGKGRKPKLGVHDKVIVDAEGAPLFRVRHLRDSVALIIPADKTTARRLDLIEARIAQILRTRDEDLPASRKRYVDVGEITATALLDLGAD